VVEEEDSRGIPISFYVTPNGNVQINYIETPSNHVLSMFGRRSLAAEIQDAYDNDKVLDQNKEKIRRLREKLDSQWSTSKLNQTDFNNSINNYKKIVKQLYYTAFSVHSIALFVPMQGRGQILMI